MKKLDIAYGYVYTAAGKPGSGESKIKMEPGKGRGHSTLGILDYTNIFCSRRKYSKLTPKTQQATCLLCTVKSVIESDNLILLHWSG